MVTVAVTVVDASAVFWATAIGALGIFLIFAGLFGLIPPLEDPKGLPGRLSNTAIRMLCAGGAAGAVFAITQWPIAAIWAGVGGWFFLTLKNAKRARHEAIDRVDAIATWVENLRDNISGSAGLQQALRMSADHAPGPIRTEVRDLVLRLQHEPVTIALRRFASDVAHPTSDMAVGCLILASSRSAGSLAQVLAKTAQAARDSASMLRQVDAGRAAVQSQAKIVAIIAALGTLLLTVTQREFVAPYDTPGGQVALFIICGLFFASGYALYQLAKVVPPTRVFKGVENAPEQVLAEA